MKPATYKETVLIVQEWSAGRLKVFLIGRHITYHCAMMRIMRFRRAYPEDYKAAIKC